MPPNNIPKKFVLRSRSRKRTGLLYRGEGEEGKNPKQFHSQAIYLFSTAYLHIKCPGAKSSQLGGLLAALLGEVPELLPFLFDTKGKPSYLLI